MFHSHLKAKSRANSLNLLVALGKVGASEKTIWESRSLHHRLTPTKKPNDSQMCGFCPAPKKRESLKSRNPLRPARSLDEFCLFFSKRTPFFRGRHTPYMLLFRTLRITLGGLSNHPASTTFLRGAEFGLCRISWGAKFVNFVRLW